jgi:ribosomal protein L11 methyltransferase
VVPSWIPYEPQPDDLVIHLDPGLAFGTGLHETTRLCLQRMEDHLTPGDRVLDVGTGSGILSIAGVHLGAREVVALDADPQAVVVSKENIMLNGVQDQVQVAWGTLSGGEPSEWQAPLVDPGPPFDLVVVNILAHVVEALLHGGLAQMARPGGLLIASGIGCHQADSILELMGTSGLEVVEQQAEGDWVGLVGRRTDRR